MYTWNEELSVGVAELDEQHQHLFDVINQLLRITEGSSKRPVSESFINLLESLMNYGLYHLSAEEEHMREFDCVNHLHLQVHLDFKDQLKRRHAEAVTALRADSPEVLSIVKDLAMHTGDWHMGHIQHMDKTYTACFNEHGLQ